MTEARPWLGQLEQDGFAILPGVFADAQVEAVLAGLAAAFDRAAEDEAARRSQAGGVFAARNVLALWPPAATAWRQPPLPAVLRTVLGPGFGLVRALFFDKPPTAAGRCRRTRT